MAAKTANVTARIQPDIKKQAEKILERLGIPVSVFIDMAYRQVIMRDGVPFSLNIPDKLITRDIITATEFDTVMQTGLEQAKSDVLKYAIPATLLFFTENGPEYQSYQGTAVKHLIADCHRKILRPCLDPGSKCFCFFK